MVLITIVTGAYKPTYNWGAPSCRWQLEWFLCDCFSPVFDQTMFSVSGVWDNPLIGNVPLFWIVKMRSNMHLLDDVLLVTLWWKYKKQWKITIFNGKIHYKWPCSIAFCMFTRGYWTVLAGLLANDGWSGCANAAGTTRTRSTQRTARELSFCKHVSSGLEGCVSCGWSKKISTHRIYIYI